MSGGCEKEQPYLDENECETSFAEQDHCSFIRHLDALESPSKHATSRRQVLLPQMKLANRQGKTKSDEQKPRELMELYIDESRGDKMW